VGIKKRVRRGAKRGREGREGTVVGKDEWEKESG
jgi:hypothetical protein